MAAGWPLTDFTERGYEPIFGPDGTVYLLAGTRDARGDYRQSLVALDTAGFVKPGWPIQEPPGSYFGSLGVGPDGSVYLGECGAPQVGCVLHRLDGIGRELPGWPFEVPRDFACPAGSFCGSIDFGPNNTTYFFDRREVGGLQVIAIDASGQVMSGWPVAPDAPGLWWSDPHVGSDGTLFLLGVPDGREASPLLAAYAPDGSLREGWPVSMPGQSDYLLGPQANVVVWSLVDLAGELCQQPRRTVFTVLGPDGRALPGWPRGSTGYASSPVVDADGTVHYVSALGNVYAHDRAGEVKNGWPVAVPGAAVWCGPTDLYLAPDGTIYVLSGEVAALSPDGRRRPGWPYRPAGDLNLPCWPVGDTDGVPSPHAPAFGPDGTVYLVVCHAETTGPRLDIIALEPQGQLKPGWPYQLPIDPATVQLEALTVSPDGRLFVRGGYDTKSFLLALDPDGRLSE